MSSIELKRKVTYRSTFVLTQPDGDDQIPLPLTNKILVFHLVRSGSVEDYLALSTEDDPNDNGSYLSITDELGGEAELHISDEETALMKFNEGNWWLELKLTNGDSLERGAGSATIRHAYE